MTKTDNNEIPNKTPLDLPTELKIIAKNDIYSSK